MEEADALPGFSLEERERAKHAYAYMRAQFGQGFFDEFEPPARHHLILTYVYNSTAWTRRWLTWFATALEETSKGTGHGDLVAALRTPSRFLEALSILRHAHRFHLSGFNVDFEPPTRVGTRIKKPDFCLIHRATGERIYVEVSTLGASKPERQAREQMEALFSRVYFDPPGLAAAARLSKIIDPSRLRDVADAIWAAASKAHAEHRFIAYVHEDCVEAGFAPRAQAALLEAWAKSRGLHMGSFMSDMPPTNEGRRLDKRLEAEQTQLPPEVPGLVILESIGLFRDDDMALAEASVRRHRHLLGLLIYRSWYGEPVPPSETWAGPRLLVTRTMHGVETQQQVFVHNVDCAHALLPETRASFLTALRA